MSLPSTTHYLTLAYPSVRHLEHQRHSAPLSTPTLPATPPVNCSNMDATRDRGNTLSAGTGDMATHALDPRLTRALRRYQSHRDSHPWWRETQNVRLIVVFLAFITIISSGAGVFMALEGEDMDSRHGNNTALVERLRGSLNTSDMSALMAMIPDPADTIHALGYSSYARCWIMAFTMSTTIGYGLVTPITVGGQVFSIFYAIVSVPIAGLALLFLAERLL